MKNLKKIFDEDDDQQKKTFCYNFKKFLFPGYFLYRVAVEKIFFTSSQIFCYGFKIQRWPIHP